MIVPGERKGGRRGAGEGGALRAGARGAMSAGRRKLIVAAALVAMVVAAFGRSLEHPFLEYDDDDYVTKNVHVQQGVTLKTLTWALTSVGYASNWHPSTWVSHMIDVQLFGLDAHAHHLMNIVIHSANAILLLLMLEALTGLFWRSAFVASLWAVHPLLVESVARVAERKDLLSGLFWMATVILYVRYVRDPGLPRYLAVLGTCALGLMSKPTVVTLPFALWLLDYWPLGRIGAGGGGPSNIQAGINLSRRNALIAEKVPLLFFSMAAAAATYAAQTSGGMTATWQRFTLGDRVANAVQSYAAYAVNAIWPANLSPLYPHAGADLSLPRVLLLGAALSLISIASLVALRRHPHFFVGWAWYLGVLVPMIGLVQVGVQGRADRYVYVPVMGLLLAITWSLAYEKWRPAARAGVLLALAGVLAALTTTSRTQVRHWASDLAVYQRALATTSRNWLAEYNVGVYLERSHRFREAALHYQASLAILPGNPHARNNLGVLLAREGKDQEAIQHYRLALAIAPASAQIHYNLGNALSRVGDFPAAVEELEEAVRFDPKHFGARMNIARIFYDRGDYASAAKSYEGALDLEPGSAEAHLSRGMALEALGDPSGALSEYRLTLLLRPDSRDARAGIARVTAGRVRTR